MRVERKRENVFTLTATSQELSALIAGARMALKMMQSAPEGTAAEPFGILEHVLLDFDHARQRLEKHNGPGGG